MDPKEFNKTFGITENYSTINSAYVSKNAWTDDKFILWINNKDEVFAEGDNSWGQLGLGHRNKIFGQAEIKVLSQRNISDFYQGNCCIFAKSRDGQVFCWGSNHNGQLGIGEEYGDQVYTLPMKNLLPNNIDNISCGDHHCLALTESREVYAWGLNEERQLLLKTKESIISEPRKILTNISSNYIFCYSNTSLAIDSNGKLHLWGGLYGETEIAFYINSQNLLFRKAVVTDDNIFLISSGSVYKFEEDIEGEYHLNQIYNVSDYGGNVENLTVDIDGNLIIQHTKIVFKLVNSFFKETQYFTFQKYFMSEFNITYGTYTNPFSKVGENCTQKTGCFLDEQSQSKKLDKHELNQIKSKSERQDPYLEHEITIGERFSYADAGAIIFSPLGINGFLMGYTAGSLAENLIEQIKKTDIFKKVWNSKK